MGSRLDQFIQDNRDQFDGEEPREQVWQQLQAQLASDAATQKKVVSIKRPVKVLAILKWAAAAVVVIFAGFGVYSAFNNHTTVTPDVVKHTTVKDTPAVVPDPIIKDINPTYAKEVYQFTQLIEVKQNELKAIEKDNPDLYRKFVSDINKLDTSYNALKRELPNNPNREQLLEAMIENLRLQTEILNQQLHIINQIKAAKNNGHESNSKNI